MSTEGMISIGSYKFQIRLSFCNNEFNLMIYADGRDSCASFDGDVVKMIKEIYEFEPLVELLKLGYKTFTSSDEGDYFKFNLEDCSGCAPREHELALKVYEELIGHIEFPSAMLTRLTNKL